MLDLVELIEPLHDLHLQGCLQAKLGMQLPLHPSLLLPPTSWTYSYSCCSSYSSYSTTADHAHPAAVSAGSPLSTDGVPAVGAYAPTGSASAPTVTAETTAAYPAAPAAQSQTADAVLALVAAADAPSDAPSAVPSAAAYDLATSAPCAPPSVFCPADAPAPSAAADDLATSAPSSYMLCSCFSQFLLNWMGWLQDPLANWVALFLEPTLRWNV